MPSWNTVFWEKLPTEGVWTLVNFTGYMAPKVREVSNFQGLRPFGFLERVTTVDAFMKCRWRWESGKGFCFDYADGRNWFPSQYCCWVTSKIEKQPKRIQPKGCGHPQIQFWGDRVNINWKKRSFFSPDFFFWTDSNSGSVFSEMWSSVQFQTRRWKNFENYLFN